MRARLSLPLPQMALGARSAKDTNRAGAAEDFVRHGADKATITVTLVNVGLYAYDHSRFGDTITVTRTLPGTAFTLSGPRCPKAVKSNIKEIERMLQVTRAAGSSRLDRSRLLWGIFVALALPLVTAAR